MYLCQSSHFFYELFLYEDDMGLLLASFVNVKYNKYDKNDDVNLANIVHPFKVCIIRRVLQLLLGLPN